jgi:DNA-binding transcriptional ArsR family regulator
MAKTVAEMFAEVKTVVAEAGRDDLVEFVEKRAEMAAKRNSNRKPSKAQIENEGIKTSIVELLEGSEPMRSGEIATAVGISPNKCSALLSQLRKGGVVKREYEKKVAYFSLGEDAEFVGDVAVTLDD